MSEWKERKRPICLERRFEFATYEDTRDFLDSLSDLSEATGLFPDISFGKTYVNITLRPEIEGDDQKLTDQDYLFSRKVNEIFD